MNDKQKKRIADYIRWGLTQEQAENWVLLGMYPDYRVMKNVRRNRWKERELQ